MAPERLADSVEETLLLQLAQRKIDGNAAGRGHGALPFTEVGAHSIEHPLAELQDQIALFRYRYEVRWQHADESENSGWRN